MKLDIYSFSLYSINICIIIYSGFIYKVLSITYSRFFRGIYINYNTIKLFSGIIFCSNIYKWVLFTVYNVYNKFNRYI